MQEKSSGGSTSAILKNGSVFTLLLTVSLLLYANTISNQFVFDDIPIIVENPAIRTLSNLPDILGVTTGRPLYRPVRFISYLIDYSFSGLNPTAYHISNMVYHALAGFIFFLIVQCLTGSLQLSLISALLLILHPVHTDSVAYISGRRDILTTLFYLLGFYCFVRYREKESLRYLFLTFISFIFAIGSKEMAVTLPAVCLLYDVTWGGTSSRGEGPQRTAWERFKPYSVLFIIGAAFCYYKLVVFYPSLRDDFYGGSAVSNFATVFRILCRYLQLMFFPVVLHADYSVNAFPVSSTFFEPAVVMSVGIIAVALFLIFASRNRRKAVFFGGLWFFITLLPVCHIFPHHEILAEHYLYLPSCGFLILLVPLWEKLLSLDRRFAIAAILVILVIFFSRTVIRNRDWKDSLTVWTKVLETTPECARANDNMGSQYFNIFRDYQKALWYYEKAVKLKPGHAVFHNNLGTAYGAIGEIEKAETEFNRAIDLDRKLAASYNNLGIVHFKRGDYKQASVLFWKSALRKPDPKAWYNCGSAVLKLGETDKAIESYEKALKYNRNYPEAYCMLGVAYRRKGEPEKALKKLVKAISLKQDYTDAYYQIGVVYYHDLGDMDKAFQVWQKAIELNPGMKKAYLALADLLSERGGVTDAVELYEKALSRWPDDSDVLYRLGRLYRIKLKDREKTLWYLNKAVKAASDPKMKKRIQKEINSIN